MVRKDPETKKRGGSRALFLDDVLVVARLPGR